MEADAEKFMSLVLTLVQSINKLLATYKYFNNSFVLNDKDFMKYLAKEMRELKGLFGAFGVNLE